MIVFHHGPSADLPPAPGAHLETAVAHMASPRNLEGHDRPMHARLSHALEDDRNSKNVYDADDDDGRFRGKRPTVARQDVAGHIAG